MANMRAIRARIKSVTNTEQITKAMKMVAASKLRRVQDGMYAMRSFSAASQEIMDTLLSGQESSENEFTHPRKKVKKVCYVLFVGNRGLCGMYNHTILRYMQDLAENETREYEIIVCGRWGKDMIANSGLNVRVFHDEMSDTPTASEALALAEELKHMYLNGEADEVHLVYMAFVSALGQKPAMKQLLPAKIDSSKESESKGGNVIIFEPDTETVLASVIRLYIDNQVYATMLEARCGEHSSRMMAMTTAADSTKELIAELGLELNRARQAAITTEINEIVGGAAALKKKK